MSTATQELEYRAVELPVEAEGMAITNQVSYDQVVTFLQEVLIPFRKKIVATFKPIKQAQDAAKRETLAQEKRHLDPITKAEGIVKGKLLAWSVEQDRIRKEEQARLDAEAQRLADEDLESQIEHAETHGASPEEIDAIIEQPSVAPIPAAPPTFQKAAGIATRDNWKAVLSPNGGKLKLVGYVAQHPEWLHLLDVNQTALNQLARAQKSLLNIPGVRPENEKIIAGRGR